MAFLRLESYWEVWLKMANSSEGTKSKTVEKCTNKQRYHAEENGRGYS